MSEEQQVKIVHTHCPKLRKEIYAFAEENNGMMMVIAAAKIKSLFNYSKALLLKIKTAVWLWEKLPTADAIKT